MVCIVKRMVAGVALLGLMVPAGAEPLVLKASKDTFGRSNERNRNNGGSETLLVAHASNIRTIIAFDLSSATNGILGAELRIRPHSTMPKAIDLVVAPMVQTQRNAEWGEGSGNLGALGQNSSSGDASYAWSAFPDVPWESADGASVVNLGDPRLWASPVASLRNLQWKEGEWVSIKINDVSMLEKIRTSENPFLSFGLWGTSGNGLYAIGSKESGHAPELVLTLEKDRP